MASNVGGAATLIGDPPNILIGSAASLSFTDFVLNLAPVVLLALPFVLVFFYFVFRRELRASEDGERTIGKLNARGAIRDRILLRKSLIVLGAVIVGFFLHGALHLEAATIALFGAAVLMLYARSDVHEVLREVEWPTLLFFVGLFVLVGGLEVTGFIGRIAELPHRCRGLTGRYGDAGNVGERYRLRHRGQYPLYGDHDPRGTGIRPGRGPLGGRG
jgi:Na+/H+ antiporter NhaD/arsenite permease-like protein